MIEWRFPSNDYGENKGINDSGVAIFRGTPLKSLAREICQNSLDAAAKERTIVQFNAFKIKSSEIPGRDVLEDTFNRCLSFWSSQKAKTTKEFFTAALECIQKDECNFLRISDFNTTGLTGSRKEINSDWTNLTKSSGASDKKGTAGGSYGIGKYAPFACSYLSTVFYSTYDINDECASQGVSRLVTFTRPDGQNTQGTGYFGGEKNTPIFEEMHLDPDFSRITGQYGTDIYIAGYKFSKGDWQKDIIVSLLDGFLGAFWNNKLEVTVGNVLISKDTLGEVIDLYRDDLTGYTDKYYNVLTSENTVWKKENFLGLGEIKLGLLLGNSDAPTRIAMIRQTGMKIMDKDRLPGHVPYMGIMFINGIEINEKLRLIENPEHTKWEPERSNNLIEARQILKALNDFIREQVENIINSGTGESIDAIGVGTYLPDDAEDSKDQAYKESISERIVNIEVKEIASISASQKIPGEFDSTSKETMHAHMEPGGDNEEWIHDDGEIEKPGGRPGIPAHPVPEGDIKVPKPISVNAEKFVCLCINKDEGKYMLRVSPDRECTDGEIELFLSAETQRYPAPITNAVLIGGGSVSVEENKIKGVSFVKGKDLRLSIEIDYSDYCSMEVELYAASK